MVNAHQILIVDDEIDIREILRFALETPGRLVFEAGNGEEALSVVEKEKIDLILTDLAMPKMNGFELLRKLKMIGKSLPIIVLTGHADSMVANQIRPYGVVHFLTKPWDSDHLDKIVQEILAKIPIAE